MKLRILDTETTGVGTGTEILQIGIIDENGNTLLNQYLKPVNHENWEGAEKIHGITPLMVQNCIELSDIEPILIKLLTDSKLLIYNKSYDFPLLPQSVRDCIAECECVMLSWQRFNNLRKWDKLENAAQKAGFDWQGNKAHDAIGDCLATLTVYDFMNKEKLV